VLPDPSFERVRSAALDRLCESIGEHRDTMNAAKADERADISAALQVMQKRNITVYRHARVELARVPGAEKLRVRMTKEEGDAGETDLESAEVAAEAVAADTPADAEELQDAIGGEIH